MRLFSRTTLTIIVFFFVVLLYQQTKETAFFYLGQAESGKNVPRAETSEHIDENESLNNERKPVNLVAEAKREKLLLDNTTASRALQLQQELEERHQKFREEVRTSDVTTLDLRKPSGLTAGQADRLLEGTGLEGLGKAFVEAEQKHEVNAYYLMAHAAWESGWGRSKICREKNNLFGYMAYDGSAYRSAKRFESKAESIDVVAQFIRENYLEETGRYYHGPTLKGMNVRYASDHNWNRGIGQVMVSLVNKLPASDSMIA